MRRQGFVGTAGLCAALLCAALLCAALLWAPAASAAQLRGAALHPLASDHDRGVIRRGFALLQAAGATSVRFDVFWAAVEGSGPGRYDPSTLAWVDWVMREAQRHDLRVILDVWAAPCWASSVPASVDPVGCGWGWWSYPVVDYPPTSPQDYAGFCAFAAKRWGSYLAALELWNEPNGSEFFISSTPASDYAALVKAAYPAVKAVAPALPVIMSLGGTDTTFLGYLYSLGVRGFYDGIAVHPYYQSTFAGLKAFRAYQLERGDTAPLWVTEVGWSSAMYGEWRQAANVASALRALAALPYVVAVEIYDLRDGGSEPRNAEDHFGLLHVDMRPKPAFSRFATTIHSLGARAIVQQNRPLGGARGYLRAPPVH